MKRFVVLINAAAGMVRGRLRGANPKDIADAFADAGIEAAVHLGRPRELERLAARLIADQPDALIVGGGDGTISAIANLVADRHVPLGVLPLGTLNHFARDLGMPQDTQRSIAGLANGTIGQIDVGEVNGRLFVNNCSLGAYPQVVLHRERHRRRGSSRRFAILRAAVRTLIKWKMLRVIVDPADGRRLPRATPFLFVGNNRYELALPATGRRRRLDQGSLSVYVAHRPTRLRLLWVAVLALVGRLDAAQEIDEIDCERLTVNSRRHSLRVAIDGEVMRLETPLEFRVRRAGLSVVLPAGVETEPQPLSAT